MSYHSRFSFKNKYWHIVGGVLGCWLIPPKPTWAEDDSFEGLMTALRERNDLEAQRLTAIVAERAVRVGCHEKAPLFNARYDKGVVTFSESSMHSCHIEYPNDKSDEFRFTFDNFGADVNLAMLTRLICLTNHYRHPVEFAGSSSGPVAYTQPACTILARFLLGAYEDPGSGGIASTNNWHDEEHMPVLVRKTTTV